ncbi:MAG: hypothetical protein ACRDMV_16880 [Streptosporangiales bacterium]
MADTDQDHERQDAAEHTERQSERSAAADERQRAAEHTERQDERSAAADERQRAEARRRERRQAWRADLRALRVRLVRIATSVVTIVAVVFAVVLAFRIVFAIFPVNPSNSLVEFVRSWADGLVLFFGHLFTPDDHRVAVLVNYGLAAVFWLVVGRIAAGIIRRLG